MTELPCPAEPDHIDSNPSLIPISENGWPTGLPTTLKNANPINVLFSLAQYCRLVEKSHDLRTTDPSAHREEVKQGAGKLLEWMELHSADLYSKVRDRLRDIKSHNKKKTKSSIESKKMEPSAPGGPWVIVDPRKAYLEKLKKCSAALADAAKCGNEIVLALLKDSDYLDVIFPTSEHLSSRDVVALYSEAEFDSNRKKVLELVMPIFGLKCQGAGVRPLSHIGEQGASVSCSPSAPSLGLDDVKLFEATLTDSPLQSVITQMLMSFQHLNDIEMYATTKEFLLNYILTHDLKVPAEVVSTWISV